ncbi:MAG: undecaprenyl-diphosphate phosphatase [Candidatus Micrarchaeota archaeon]
MDIFQALFLGVLQGLTEWLPISSSAHLALAQNFLGLGARIAFDVMLHFSTLLAVLAFYARDILAIAKNFLKRNSREQKFVMNIIIASVPTAIIGFAFKDFFESMFSSPLLIALALLITGAWLMLASRAGKGERGVSGREAFVIGVAQGLSVAPGISRSGATIGAGLLLGVDKKEAARFSFLAAIPAIIGAAIFEGRKAVFSSVEPSAVIVGTAAAALVGYFAISLLLRVLEKNKLEYFAYYCFALAVFVIGAVMLAR